MEASDPLSRLRIPEVDVRDGMPSLINSFYDKVMHTEHPYARLYEIDKAVKSKRYLHIDENINRSLLLLPHLLQAPSTLKHWILEGALDLLNKDPKQVDTLKPDDKV